MADISKLPIRMLRADPFHSDDSRDVMLRRVRDLVARPVLRTSLLAANSGGPADQAGRFGYLFPELAADP